MRYSDEERRRRVLSEEDLHDIREEIREEFKNVLKESVIKDHPCRLSNVSAKDLEAAMDFYKSFKKALDDTKSTVRRFIIVTLMTLITGLIGLGTWVKYKGD